MEKMRKPRKLPEQIADRLREMIIQEEMKTGMKLPAEGELMARFGVSRSTVREAVKILQTENIVDIRQGQGTFLCAMPGLKQDPLGLRFADQQELIAHLLEIRLLIEPGVAALAAQRRREEDLVQMKALLDRMDNAYLHGEDYTPYDAEFHSVIAKAARNDVVPGTPTPSAWRAAISVLASATWTCTAASWSMTASARVRPRSDT